jgi:hypothetical protein
MGVKHIEAFGDSLLVMLQIADTFQCFDGSLNAYLDKCLEIITLFDVFRDENTAANDLAQQASGFWSNQGKFGFLEKLDVPVYQTECFGFQPMQSAEICSAESDSAKLDDPVSETGGCRISRSSDNLDEMMTIDLDDWRTILARYLENPIHIVDRKVWWQALKYVVLDDTLYRWTIDGLLLKCLGSDQSKIAMRRFMKGFVVPINQLIR